MSDAGYGGSRGQVPESNEKMHKAPKESQSKRKHSKATESKDEGSSKV